MRIKNLPNNLIFMLIGFTATGAQVVYIRELLAVFHGNELAIGIVFANWLLWSALGSYLSGKLALHFPDIRHLLIVYLLLLAFSLPLTILLIRFITAAVRSTPTELLGLAAMLLVTFIALSLFCLISGGLYAVASRFHLHLTNQSLATSMGYVYLMEALGAALAGLLLTLLLIEYVAGLTICIVLGCINFLMMVWFTWHKSSVGVKWVIRIIAISYVLMLLIFSPLLESKSTAGLWNSFSLVKSFPSRYGKLELISSGTSKTLYENGVALFSVPDRQAAEEAVHFSLLQHPHPQKVLLIGGGVAGSLQEILKHPSVQGIDYVELNPRVIEIAQNYFSSDWEAIAHDGRIHIHHLDGRLYLQRTSSTYDVIILNLPEPYNAQLNRFYTREFFELCRQRLNPEGLVALQAQAAENYINDALADYLRCLHKTLSAIFADVAFIPGDRIHLFGALQSGILARSAELFVERLHHRQLDTEYVREYYLPFRFNELRMNYFKERITPFEYTDVNRDFHPVAYYFHMILWSSQFSSFFVDTLRCFEQVLRFRNLMGVFILLLVAAFLYRLVSGRNSFATFPGLSSILIMGFSGMAAEILILLIFQAVYGYIYHQLALLIAFYMVGLATGSWISVRNLSNKAPDWGKNRFTLFLLHSLMALLVVVLTGLFGWLPAMLPTAWAMTIFPPLFSLSVFGIGWLGGYHFPQISRLYYETGGKHRNPGIIYGMDLLGGLLSALILSAFVIPLLGYYISAWLIAAVNLPAMILLIPNLRHIIIKKSG